MKQCEECKGKGHIILFVSTVECEECEGTGELRCEDEALPFDHFTEMWSAEYFATFSVPATTTKD